MKEDLLNNNHNINDSMNWLLMKVGFILSFNVGIQNVQTLNEIAKFVLAILSIFVLTYDFIKRQKKENKADEKRYH